MSSKSTKKTDASTHQRQQTPYAGCLDGQPVETAPHVLVSGPTGRGKSMRVLVPGALMWRGPRVLVSSKTDFMREVVKRGIHRRGEVFVMDLTGEVDDSFDWLQGVEYTRVIPDPTSLIDNDDDALAMASMLMKVGSLGASDGGGGGGGNDAFWQTQAAQPLAALLLAGKASGEGVGWSLRAVGKPAKDDEDDVSPSWANAFELVEQTSFHASKLLAAGAKDPKLRDSIAATMEAGLVPWAQTTVRGTGSEAAFAPTMLETAGEPTLAMVVPADGAAAGAAVAVAETIIRHWRRGIERGLPRVLLSVDEFANVMPIPKISTYLSEARGLGVACVLALQSTESQLDEQYGEARGSTIREVAPAVLILQGDPGSRQLLESAAWWDGEEDAWTESIDAQGRASLSAQRVQRTSAQSLLPKNLEEGRLLLYGQKGHMVDLPGIWDFAA